MMKVEIRPDGKGGFEVVFVNAKTDEPFSTVCGFATDSAAQEFVRKYLVELMVAMRPLV